MQRANGRQRQNNFRFKARQRDAPDNRVDRACEPQPQPEPEDNEGDSGVTNSSAGNVASSSSTDEQQSKPRDKNGRDRDRDKNGPKAGSSSGSGHSGAFTNQNKKSFKPEKHHHVKEEALQLPGPSNRQQSVQSSKDPGLVHHLRNRETVSTSSGTKQTESINCTEKVMQQDDVTAEGEWQVQKFRGAPKKTTKGSNSTISNNEANKNSLAFIPEGTSETQLSIRKKGTLPSKIAEAARPPRSIDKDYETDIKPTQPSVEAGTVKKKKKKKPGSKEERRSKRDEATLRELYKPKDSHVHILTPELFQKIKTGSQPTLTPRYSQDTDTASMCANFRFGATTLSCGTDFPELDKNIVSTASSSSKSFAAALASTIPQIPVISSVTEVTIGANKISANGATTPSTVSTDQSSFTTHSSSATIKQKLSKRPITFSLGDLMQSSTHKHNIVNKQIAKKTKRDKLSIIRENPKFTVGNLLDSSGPVVIHRGKIKEKKKKPSKLKKCILKSRELRKCVYTEFAIKEEVVVDQQAQNESGDDTLPEKRLDSDSNNANSEIVPEVKPEKPCAIPDAVDVITGENGVQSDLGSRGKGNANLFQVLLDSAEKSSKASQSIPGAVIEFVKLQMHSRKFRPYCDMYVSKELHGLVIPMMKELYRLQDRIYKTDPIKLLTKRRYINGIKEVANALKLNKAQMVILAPDMEPSSGEGGLDEKITEIISLAREKSVPYIFSGNRFILGKCIMQLKSPVSAMAILDKQSVEGQFNKVLEEAQLLREKYQCEFNRRVQEVMANGG